MRDSCASSACCRFLRKIGSKIKFASLQKHWVRYTASQGRQVKENTDEPDEMSRRSRIVSRFSQGKVGLSGRAGADKKFKRLNFSTESACCRDVRQATAHCGKIY